MGLRTDIIMGLLTAVFLSVIITQGYGQFGREETGTSSSITAIAMNKTAYYAKQAETKGLFNATLQAQLTNPQIQALKAQDPEFNNFGNIVADCTDIADGYNNLPANQCNLSIQSALDQWCLLDDDYYAEKCNYVQGVQQNYTRALELSYELFLFQQQQERGGGAALAP